MYKHQQCLSAFWSNRRLNDPRSVCPDNQRVQRSGWHNNRHDNNKGKHWNNNKGKQQWNNKGDHYNSKKRKYS